MKGPNEIPTIEEVELLRDGWIEELDGEPNYHPVSNVDFSQQITGILELKSN